MIYRIQEEHNAKLQMFHERARAQGNLRGDALIAPPWSSYPAGSIYDYICLGCGDCRASHDEDSDCWRVLHSDADLARYDQAMEIADAIKYGKPSIVAINGESVRASLCAPKQNQREKTSEDG